MEPLVVAVQAVVAGRAASMLLSYRGGLTFAFANGPPEVLSRDAVERQIRAVAAGRAAHP